MSDRVWRDPIPQHQKASGECCRPDPRVSSGDSPVGSRLIGRLAGSVAIQLLNLVRVTSLRWLGAHHRGVFDLFHAAVWQSLVILAAISIFLLWSLKFAERPLADSR